nr:hypothetical protein CFP56_53513 [Quercus suber]
MGYPNRPGHGAGGAYGRYPPPPASAYGSVYPPAPLYGGGYPPAHAYGGYPPAPAYGGYPPPPAHAYGGYPPPPAHAYGGYPPAHAYGGYPPAPAYGGYQNRPSIPGIVVAGIQALAIGFLYSLSSDDVGGGPYPTAVAVAATYTQFSDYN